MNTDMYIQLFTLYFYKELRFKKWVNDSIVGIMDYPNRKDFQWEINIRPLGKVNNRLHTKFECMIDLCYKSTKQTLGYTCKSTYVGLNDLTSYIGVVINNLQNEEYLSTYDGLMEWIDKCINPIKEGRYVNDTTFSTRLLSYIEKTENMAMTAPHLFEEYEYLKKVATKLQDYQKTTATIDEEVEYFKRLEK